MDKKCLISIIVHWPCIRGHDSIALGLYTWTVQVSDLLHAVRNSSPKVAAILHNACSDIWYDNLKMNFYSSKIILKV